MERPGRFREACSFRSVFCPGQDSDHAAVRADYMDAYRQVSITRRSFWRLTRGFRIWPKDRTRGDVTTQRHGRFGDDAVRAEAERVWNRTGSSGSKRVARKRGKFLASVSLGR